MEEQAYAVVLAGGRGTRLWPLSRLNRPKQFLRFGADGTMLQATVRRIKRLIPPDRILISTVAAHRERVREDLPELPPENVLVEPSQRGTGPAVVLAARRIAGRNPKATMLVLPSDHLIVDEQPYVSALRKAIQTASAGALVCLGIRPETPSTAYGWMRVGPVVEAGPPAVHRVLEFVEKPPRPRAEALLATGDSLWNGGTYAWTLPAFFEALSRHAPRLAAAIPGPEPTSADYLAAPAESIDRALIERADARVVVVADYRRIDLGNLESLSEVLPGKGSGTGPPAAIVTRNARDNLVHVPNRTVALIGVERLVIVDAGDILLVCDRAQIEEIPALLRDLESAGRADLL